MGRGRGGTEGEGMGKDKEVGRRHGESNARGVAREKGERDE